MNNLLKLFIETPENNSCRALIADSLRLFSDSSRVPSIENSFLHYWQIIETICLSEKIGGQTKKVLARVKWHLKKSELMGDTVDVLTLKNFANKRNDYVHRGIKNINQKDVLIIKYLCEIAFNWLIDNEKKLKNKLILENFYKFRTSSNKELEDTKIALKIINR